MLTGGDAAAHCLHGVEVRGDCDWTESAGEPALVVSSFWSLASWFFRAANSDAVGGGADAVAAAATDVGAGGGEGGKREERGRFERESSI